MLKQALFILLTLLSRSTSAQQTSAEWLRTITANALTAPGQSVHPGYALYFTQVGDLQVPYIVYVPKQYHASRPTPVIVFLHGAILAKEDFQYKDPEIAGETIFQVADTLNAIVVFPFSKSGFAWPAQPAACENIFTILALLQQHYNVDKQHIYLGGISMGGHGTYWFINNKPEMFAGFYTFSAHPGDIRYFTRLAAQKPLYAMYAEDDPSISYNDVKGIYEQHKAEAPGFHISSVQTGGHRFIYRPGGVTIVRSTLTKLMNR